MSMNELLKLDQYSIVVVPFPYADQLAEKRRPALIISSPVILMRHNLVWVAMITSAKNQRWEKDIEISNHHECGLPAPSLLRLAKIATIDANRIIKTLGQLPAGEQSKVQEFFVNAFGLPEAGTKTNA